MDRYLEKIKTILPQHFGNCRIKDSPNLNQIKNNSRFIFCVENIFGEAGYSELGIGFEFAQTPALKVWIWVNEKNTRASHFKAALVDSNLNNNGVNWLGITDPLSDYVSSDGMEQEIEVWFSESFEKIKLFRTMHPELNWRI